MEPTSGCSSLYITSALVRPYGRPEFWVLTKEFDLGILELQFGPILCSVLLQIVL